MGLRLYQAPVESDIQSKPAAEKTSAQARSSIRRGQWRSSASDSRSAAREHRRRRVAAAAAAASATHPFYPAELFSSDFTGRQSPPSDAPATSSVNSDNNPTVPETGRRALRHMAGRLGILDDRMLAALGERWAHLYTESNPSPSRNDDIEPPSLSNMAVEPEFLPPRRSRLPPLTESYAISSIRSTQEAGHSSRTSSRGYNPRRRIPETSRDSPRPAPRARERLSFEATSFVEPPTFDGLGDRNRSLSPEGDHVWDTLLTTLTPDPQPPSVGSSFASASASAVASQSAATGSSRTSFASPDTAEESAFEPPCESGCEGSDTEGDEEDENPLTRFPSSLRTNRRSYADVTRSSGSSTREHSLEILGGIDGMQRIVSNLARREDIPDAWWAEAGLSRTLSREASSS